ncbi:transposase [Moorena producens JHB]|uniref:Transposase n=1 Tax=Moorena producens (strain JHB) TaxID=1454205 RepID=A0A9Q9STW4_MOOP1|nr:RNA-guided endonuclease TnpB family protein [Moorena producens]WAN69565.1 transposase [Moorena producens JHB]
MMTLTYEYKLIPSQKQIVIIEDILVVCRKVWNYALRERKDWYQSRKCAINCCSLQQEYIIPTDAPYPNYRLQAANLTKAKKTNPELKRTNAQVLQQVLKTLDRAFNNMKGQGYGFPRFKNRYRMRSFVFPQFKTNPVVNNWIKLPQIGLVSVLSDASSESCADFVKMRLSRPIPEGFKIKQVRVVRRASGYLAMLSLQSEVSVPDTPPRGHPLGIDVGLDKFLATSDHELVERPRFLTKLHSKLKLTSDPAPSHGARERASCYNAD